MDSNIIDVYRVIQFYLKKGGQLVATCGGVSGIEGRFEKKNREKIFKAAYLKMVSDLRAESSKSTYG